MAGLRDCEGSETVKVGRCKTIKDFNSSVDPSTVCTLADIVASMVKGFVSYVAIGKKMTVDS